MNVDEIIEKFGLVWLCLVGMSLGVLILWKRLRVVQDVLVAGAMLTAVPVVLHAMILRDFLPIFARSDGTAVWHLAASYVWISSTVAASPIRSDSACHLACCASSRSSVPSNSAEE